MSKYLHEAAALYGHHVGKPKIFRMGFILDPKETPAHAAQYVIPPAPKLLTRLRDHLRARYDTIRTETAYLESGLAAAVFHNKHHPAITQQIGGL